MKKTWYRNFWYKYGESITIIIGISLLIGIPLILGYFVGYNKGKQQKEIIYSPPVEKNVIDTLYITRDRIINKIQYLETIKYDTIEKIYILDDSSSVELFYKLVSE